METNATKKPVQDIWQDISMLFKPWSAIRSSRVWLTSLSARLNGKRLARLRGSKEAKALEAVLSPLNNTDTKALRTFAAINQEQASAAFKTTMVGNVTIPIGVFTLLHQLSPDGLSGLIVKGYGFTRFDFWAFVLATLLSIFLIALIAVYATANLNQARDIRHLIDLHAAERGIYFGLEDMDDLSLT